MNNAIALPASRIELANAIFSSELINEKIRELAQQKPDGFWSFDDIHLLVLSVLGISLDRGDVGLFYSLYMFFNTMHGVCLNALNVPECFSL